MMSLLAFVELLTAIDTVIVGRLFASVLGLVFALMADMVFHDALNASAVAGPVVVPKYVVVVCAF